mmetsp:Transcript_47478/g.111035  ORF Transcript_47478/g.111035 Transcript_47478/m.111035 type:complete len:300 (+) Transcript_47478:38-937(+)
MAINWPGLLAWSTKYHDGTAPSQFKQLSEEDRAFLEKAMEQAFGQVEDPNKVMEEARDQIMSDTRTNESISTALEVIDRCCDDPDCARNAEKLNVLQPLLDLLSTHEGSIRMRTFEILALLFSNNPNIQAAGMERGALKACVKVAQDCPAGSEERSKAFRALVALVRNVKEFETFLLESADGRQVLAMCLDLQELPGTREKAASFTRSLVENETMLPQYVASLAAAVAKLFSQLEDVGIQYKETLASCALQLAAGFKADCPAELRAAVQTRASELEAAKDPEAEQELHLLKDCIRALSA